MDRRTDQTRGARTRWRRPVPRTTARTGAVTVFAALAFAVGGCTPAATDEPTTAAPGPTGGDVSAAATVPGQVDLPVDAFPLDDVDRVRVTLDVDARRMGYVLLAADGRVRGRSGSPLPDSNLVTTWASVEGAPGLVVGVAPPFDLVAGVWTDGSLGGRSVDRPVPGRAYSAFVLWNPQRPGHALEHVLMTGGGAFDEDGDEIPSFHVNGVLGFVDLRTGTMGVQQGDRLDLRTLEDARVGDLLVTVLDDSPGVGAEHTVRTVVVLPPGARLRAVTGLAELQVSPSRPLVLGVPVRDIGPERVGVVLRMDSDDENVGTGAGSVQWTDADGTERETDLRRVG